MSKQIDVSVVEAPSGQYGHVHVLVCEEREGRPVWPENAEDRPELGIAWTCQVGMTTDVESYAWRLTVDSNFPLEYDALERIVAKMRKMRKVYDRNVSTFGQALTFGQFVAFHLSDRTVIAWKKSTYSDSGWFAVDEVAYSIDQSVRAVSLKLS